jgi:folylpolyglutamate synthase/dihydropteroate synthase
VRLLETLGPSQAPFRPAPIIDACHIVLAGRIDIRRLPDGHEVLLDAAHNAAGAAELASFVRTNGWTGAALVFTAMKDKDVDAMLRELLPIAGRRRVHARVERTVGRSRGRLSSGARRSVQPQTLWRSTILPAALDTAARSIAARHRRRFDLPAGRRPAARRGA